MPERRTLVPEEIMGPAQPDPPLLRLGLVLAGLMLCLGRGIGRHRFVGELDGRIASAAGVTRGTRSERGHNCRERTDRDADVSRKGGPP